MTIGVTINGKHCLTDLGMYLTEAEIGQPTPQTTYLTIPGRDGSLDLSTTLDGMMHYQDRKITLTFQSTAQLSGKLWSVFLSDLLALIHGVESEIAFDGDDDYYYTGRGTVTDCSLKGPLYSVTVEFVCAPYKTNAAGEKSL
jgi:hypothetical protein